MKKNILLYIIITILACTLTAAIVYIIMDNNNEEVIEPNNNNDKEEVLEDSITLKETTTNNNTITEKYETIINGNQKSFEVTFKVTDTYEDAIFIEGSLNNEIVYKDVVYAFNIQEIKKRFNQNNFTLITSSDNKNYLLIATYLSDTSGEEMYYEIYNEDIDKINEESIPLYTSTQCVTSNLDIEPFTNKYNDIYNLEDDDYCGYSTRGKVENNQIHSLVITCESILEYRIYKINNNKVEYELKDTYNSFEYAGKIC